MLAMYLSLVVVAVMIAAVGPRSFFFCLGSVLLVIICTLGKALKFLLDLADILQLIAEILSLFG